MSEGKQVQKRLDWALFRAIPDDGKVSVVPTKEGHLQTVWPNCMIVPPYLLDPLEKIMRTVWGPGPELNLTNVRHVINMLGDVDEYASSLAALTAAATERQLNIFNDPRALAQTRRDMISQRLAGIDGLIAPKCVRFLANHPDKFRQVFQGNGFEYPVLVRPERSQTGRDLVRIDGPADWDKVHMIPWGGKHIYMTQFVENADASGRYSKIRVAIAGQRFLMRHIHYGTDWQVHFTPRTDEKWAEEKEMIIALEASEKLRSVIQKIASRIPLDYWGLDLGWAGGDADFVLFEGNPAMSMLPRNLGPQSNGRQPEHIRAETRKIAMGLLDMVRTHMEQPDQWAMARLRAAREAAANETAAAAN